MSSLSRRHFIAATASLGVGASATNGSAATVSTQAASSANTRSDEDPLGVRGDFPVVRERTYLNSAYITPVPTPVVAAGRAFVERKAGRPIPLGEMLREDRRGPRPVCPADQC